MPPGELVHTSAGRRMFPALAAAAVALILALSLLSGVGLLSPAKVLASGSVSCGPGTPGATVSIIDFGFKPSTIRVVIGVNNTVQWMNNGATMHTVTSNTGDFDSGLSPGDTFTCTFNAPGTFAYHCAIHPTMKGTVVVLGGSGTTSSTTSTASTTSTNSQQPNRIPKGIVAFVPILLTNSQPIPTSGGYDQQVTVNSSYYRAYESAGLENVEFFTKAGTIVPSWLESGNSRMSDSTVYWLKVGSRIPGGSSLTLYMGFGIPTAILFNGKTVGEAPQLSQTYGKFDSGRGVFLLYDGFATGETTASWSKNLQGGGSALVSDGLTVSFGSSQGYFVSRRTLGARTSFDSLILSFAEADDAGYVSTKLALNNGADVQPEWGGAFLRSDCNSIFPDQLNSTAEANHCGTAAGRLVNGTASAAGVFTVNLLVRSSVQTINGTQGKTTQPIKVGYPKVPAGVGFEGKGGSVSAQWLRARTSPPNGVMPSVAFGGVQVVIVIASGAGASSGNPLFFVPSSITITAGAKVTWVNQDRTSHTVTADLGAFDSGTLSPGAKFTLTFQQTGTFLYHCNFHSWMKGSIVVVLP